MKHIIIAVFFLLFFFSGCRQKQEVQIKIGRFEQALFSVPIDSVGEYVPRLEKQYGELFDMYNQGVISIGPSNDPDYPEHLMNFLTDSYMNAAYRQVTKTYPDMSGIEEGLSKGFSKYHQYFPEKVIPSVYTLISGFNQTIIISDTILAIALDKYLGKDEEMYIRLGLASYQRQLMDKKYIVSDCMKAWGYTEFPKSDSTDNVLSNILYEGKIAYYVSQVLPQTSDSIIFGYKPEQLNWCINNTQQMWTYLVEKKMLYATDYLIINKLVGPGPFTTLFTRESPGRAAVWLGYKIIQSYMKHNKVSLEELLLNNDYQGILAKAKFRP
ncbi:MAG: hypothetical protein LBQ60_08525 [Bacteroidales bacterium]|jgi:hypothetical protein|nr:hypothetical protein [Bacteroidales bacterium]